MGKIGINLSTGSIQKDEIIVGIDLGTTNSLVAMIHPSTQKPHVIQDIDKATLVPSIIHFSDQEIIVGNDARKYLETDPAHTIFSIKRLMGKSYADIKGDQDIIGYQIIDDETDALVKIKVKDKFYSPIELSSMILAELKKRAEHACKTPINKCVITVPAYFNDAQRQATRDAGKLVGLDVLRIINEPTAACLAFGIDQKNASTVAVYDLGGGTFDISILKYDNGIYEVISTNGDTYLGGDDFDKEIYYLMIEKLGLDKSKIQSDTRLVQRLRLGAIEMKKTLSQSDTATWTLDQKTIEITKEEFEDKTRYLLDKTLACCTRALNDAKLSIQEIDEILLVGGSTRMPMIPAALEKFFGKKPNQSIHPDEAVALGAAIQADVLAGNNKEILLLDITPLSLGVETMGGLMDVIIPRNSKIPTGAGREYTTAVDGQTKMKIAVYQGERDLVQHNRKLAEFEFQNIPAMPAGLPKISIVFKLNADGILNVSATELRSGMKADIEVKPQYGLTDAEVENMLMESLTHAKSDIALRALTEARTEGEQLIQATERFLVKHNSLLEAKEIEETQKFIQDLRDALLTEDKDIIHLKIEQLNEASRPYAERIMDLAVANALKGKNIG